MKLKYVAFLSAICLFPSFNQSYGREDIKLNQDEIILQEVEIVESSTIAKFYRRKLQLDFDPPDEKFTKEQHRKKPRRKISIPRKKIGQDLNTSLIRDYSVDELLSLNSAKTGEVPFNTSHLNRIASLQSPAPNMTYQKGAKEEEDPRIHLCLGSGEAYSASWLTTKEYLLNGNRIL